LHPSDLLESALADADPEELARLKDEISRRKQEQETLRAMAGNDRVTSAEQ
jgi:hypothetical protein